ncbi:Uma2 family endonuclease [uncultured Thiodictyon sp.]|uniref:Uma2 family endonuclease n=1 Tax=uncultured Thiodictyon sp. TaxID=1846217 RepID=UPI0025DCA0D7|nr:Uma2 family endonuclease [uncultured Thiodictyon sp.]
MNTTAAIRSDNLLNHIDQRVQLHGIRWQDYESLLAMRGESSGTRVTYLDGELELMTPAIDHETQKTMLGRLIETYAEERDIELQGCGSWTVRKQAKARGVEADECYVLGVWTEPPTIPDLAVEVIWTSGGIDKLEVYRGLGVPEVWFWKDGALRIYVLEGEAYGLCQRSRLLPDLDPGLIVRFMAYPSQTQAVRGFRAALKSSED